MTRVVEVSLGDGAIIFVEVPGDDSGLPERVGRTADLVRGAAESLDQALNRIKPAITTMLRGVRDLPQPPDHVEVEFGIKVTTEAGVVVARTAGEANFAIRLQWTPEGRT